MINKLVASPLMDLAVLLNRLALGAYLGWAGVGKVGGEVSKIPSSLGSFYRSPGYQKMQPDWLPESLAQVHGFALPWVELLCGLLLILGLLGRVAAGVAALLLLSIVVALGMWYGLFIEQVNYDTPENPQPGLFHPSVIMLTLAILLTVTGSGRFSLDGLWSRRRRAYVEVEER